MPDRSCAEMAVDPMRLFDPTRCGRKTRSGGSCTQWAMHGQRVCRMHGGESPQALKKAEERMRALVHPAVSSLARQIDADEFNAVRYVLDWAGFKAVEQMRTDSEIVITVKREEQPIILEHTVNRLNDGNSRTHD